MSSTLLKHIAEPAARSLVLACFALLGLALLRVKAVSLKAAVWRGVLLLALAMPILDLFAPPVRVFVPLPVETRAALAAESAQPSAPASTRRSIVLPDVTVPMQDSNPQPLAAASTAPTRHSRPIPWLLILASAYFLVAFLLLARVFAGAALANRLARAATPIRDAVALRGLAVSARRARLKAPPLLAESDALVVPVTIGVSHPAILLPSSWRDWEEGKLAAVLAHEASHVSRRDALVQRFALIHRAIFWFSPLSWWLERHLGNLAEQASDEAALAGGAERARYAETLLDFFAALESSRSRVWWQGVSMAKCGQAEKRLDRILAWRNAMPNELKKSLVVAVVVFAAPVIALTASVHPFVFQLQEQTPSASAQTPAPPAPAPKPSANPVVNPGPAPQPPVIGPAAPPDPDNEPVAPVAVSEQDVPPSPPPAVPVVENVSRARVQVVQAQKSVLAAEQQVAAVKAQLSSPATREQLQSVRAAVSAYSRAMVSYKKAVHEYRLIADEQATGGISEGISVGVNGGEAGGVSGGVYTDSGPRFVIVTRDSNSVTMSGSEEDAEHAKSLRSKIPGDFIWFERDEKPYIIRDQATVDRAKKLWAPQEELGRRQEALGKQQEALGQQQEALGRKMEEVHVKIPDLSAQMEKLVAEMKQLSANGGTVEQIGDLQSRIGDIQSRIGEIQSDAGRQQSEIGRQQGELGRQQGELGRQQGELGRQQGELARQASQQMKQLLDEAVARGLAQPE